MTGVLQGLLLAMAVWFEIRDRRERRDKSFLDSATNGPGENQDDLAAEAGGEQPDDERAPLLRNGR